MEVDYIIVGFGLAGMTFAKQLEDKGHSFVVIDDDSQVSSKVAAGVFNPVILKRFTPVWNADAQLKNLFPFYKDITDRLGEDYVAFFDTYRVFKTIEEQNNWFKACDHPLLEDKLEVSIVKEPMPGIQHYFGFGKVKGTGRVYVKRLLAAYQQYLSNKNQFIKTSFLHDDVEVTDDEITYKDITAKKIVFAEGYGIKQNPFFNYLPLVGSKGEMLFIKAPQLKLTAQIKSSLFVLPIGDDVYWVGATFNWQDKTTKPTEAGKKELLEKLETIIDTPFEVVSQSSGIRPTVGDRRPLIGLHPKHKNVAILNGLGTRGVMISPTVSVQLYNHLEHGVDLPEDVDIKRFMKRYLQGVPYSG